MAPIFLCAVYGCFLATMAELSYCDKNLRLTKSKIFSVFFQKKFADLCSRVLKSEQSMPTPLIGSPLFPVSFPLLLPIYHFVLKA